MKKLKGEDRWLLPPHRAPNSASSSSVKHCSTGMLFVRAEAEKVVRAALSNMSLSSSVATEVEGGRKCVAQNTNFQLHNIIPEPARLFLCAPAAPHPVDVVTNSPHAMNSAC